MSWAPGRKNKDKSLLAGHQKSWIWGRYAVTEALRGGSWPIAELHLADDLSGELPAEVRSWAQLRGIPVAVCTRSRLTQLCHRKNHQGYLAKMGPFPYARPRDLLDRARPGRPLVVLDGVQDPQNLGTILRTAEVLGGSGVLLGLSGSVGITAAVARSSAGAVHHLAIAQIQPADALEELGARGVLRLCTCQDGDADLDDLELSGRALAWVIGNEAEGVSPEVRQRCDRQVRIPQVGRIDSLNAAMATGIVLYETLRRHRQEQGK